MITPASSTPSDIGAIFHALGDKTRREIFERLSRGPLTVSELSAPFDITLTGVSQHLRVMTDCGLINTVKRGRVRECSINGAGLAAMEGWIAFTRQRWEGRLDRLSDLFDEEDDG